VVGALSQRLEMLCAQLGEGDLQEVAAELGVTRTLNRVLDMVRDGAGSWDETALAADLDELDAAFTDWGVDGGLTGQLRSFRQSPWTSGHPVVEAWMCPVRRCSRVEPASRDDAAPECAVTGSPCTLRRIPA
jgi:hypothetical protein